MINDSIKALIKAADLAKTKAYAPYSNFPVGAAILDNNQNIHSGCNVENSSYPLGCCAEQSAISNMILNDGHIIKTIVISSNSKEACSPCGACRQKINEFANKSTTILLCQNGEIVKSYSIEKLLPDAFNHTNLDL